MLGCVMHRSLAVCIHEIDECSPVPPIENPGGVSLRFPVNPVNLRHPSEFEAASSMPRG